MAGLHTRLSLCFSVVVRFIIFLSITDGTAGNEWKVALGKNARQLSIYISPAKAALDNDTITASCTGDTAGHPWWAVDLGQREAVSRVVITSAASDREHLTGLDNFEVYLSNDFPTVGLPIARTDSYTLCGQYNGPVNASQKITVNCATQNQKFRYLIVRSADVSAERLCIAEVAVYATEITPDPPSPPEPAQLPAQPPAQPPSQLTFEPGLLDEVLRFILILALSIGITATVFARCTVDIAKNLLNIIRTQVSRPVAGV